MEPQKRKAYIDATIRLVQFVLLVIGTVYLIKTYL
jgi:hypothetical protein